MTQQQHILNKDSTTQQRERLNNTTKGKTQQHNIEKDSNSLDKLKI